MNSKIMICTLLAMITTGFAQSPEGVISSYVSIYNSPENRDFSPILADDFSFFDTEPPLSRLAFEQFVYLTPYHIRTVLDITNAPVTDAQKLLTATFEVELNGIIDTVIFAFDVKYANSHYKIVHIEDVTEKNAPQDQISPRINAQKPAAIDTTALRGGKTALVPLLIDGNYYLKVTYPKTIFEGFVRIDMHCATSGIGAAWFATIEEHASAIYGAQIGGQYFNAFMQKNPACETTGMIDNTPIIGVFGMDLLSSYAVFRAPGKDSLFLLPLGANGDFLAANPQTYYNSLMMAGGISFLPKDSTTIAPKIPTLFGIPVSKELTPELTLSPISTLPSNLMPKSAKMQLDSIFIDITAGNANLPNVLFAKGDSSVATRLSVNSFGGYGVCLNFKTGVILLYKLAH